MNLILYYLNLEMIFFNFILLYSTVLVLPYIDMNLPRVYMSSQSWAPLPPPTPYHLSGSSPWEGKLMDWELMYTRGRFMSMYGKTNTVL